jgi:hypothetical protein
MRAHSQVSGGSKQIGGVLRGALKKANVRKKLGMKQVLTVKARTQKDEMEQNTDPVVSENGGGNVIEPEIIEPGNDIGTGIVQVSPPVAPPDESKMPDPMLPGFKPDPLEVRARECMLARAKVKDAQNELEKLERAFVQEMDENNNRLIDEGKPTRTAILVEGEPVSVEYKPARKKVKYG